MEMDTIELEKKSTAVTPLITQGAAAVSNDPETMTSRVVVYYWHANSRPPIGHAALKIQTPGQAACYLSFVPQTSVEISPEHPCCGLGRVYSTPGQFADEQEFIDYPHYHETVLYGLDTSVMWQRAMDWRQKIQAANRNALNDPDFSETIDWGLGLSNHTCTSIAFDVLEAGGMNQRLAAFGRLGSLEHVLLLTLRPTFAIVMVFPLAYAIIFDETTGKHHMNDKWMSSCFFTLETFLLCAVEKYGLPYLANSPLIRQRTLVEIHGGIDTLTQMIAFSAMGTSLLFFNIHWVEKALPHPEWVFPLVIDGLLWSGLGMAVYLVSALTVNRLLGLREGSIIKFPIFIDRLANHLKTTDTMTHHQLLRHQFNKERMLMIMMGLTFLSAFMAHRYVDVLTDDDKHLIVPSFLMIAAGLYALGYSLTALGIKRIHQQQQEILVTSRLDAEILAQLESHEPKPALFTLSAGFSTLAMLVVASTWSRNLPDAQAVFACASAGVLAFLLIAIGYALGVRYVPSSWACFWQPSSTLNASLLSDPISSTQQEAGLPDSQPSVATTYGTARAAVTV